MQKYKNVPGFQSFWHEIIAITSIKKKISERNILQVRISLELYSFDALSSEQIPGVGGFCGTGIEICTGFGPVGITKKTVLFGPICRQ